jgi:hypothetical protein
MARDGIIRPRLSARSSALGGIMPRGSKLGGGKLECKNDFCRLARQELQEVQAELERVTLILEKIQKHAQEALSWPGEKYQPDHIYYTDAPGAT